MIGSMYRWFSLITLASFFALFVGCKASKFGSTQSTGPSPQNDAAVAAPPGVTAEGGPGIFGFEGFYDIDAQLPTIEQSGVTWVRHPIFWKDIEAQPGTYTWPPSLDKTIQSLSKNRKLIVTLNQAPAWYRATNAVDYFCAPMKDDLESVEGLKKFTAALVQRYKSDVKYWEFWNEPDAPLPPSVGKEFPFGCWGDRSKPDGGGLHYAKFLKVFYDAVKGQDTTATVSTGGFLMGCGINASGTCTTDTDTSTIPFVKAVFDYEKQNNVEIFDMVGYHSYAYYNGDSLDFQTYSWNGLKQGIFPEGYGWSRYGIVRGKAEILYLAMQERGLRQRPLMLNEGGLIVWEADNSCINYESGAAAGSAIPEDTRAAYASAVANEVWRFNMRALDTVTTVAGAIWYTALPGAWKCSGLGTQVGSLPAPLTAFSFLANKLRGARHVSSSFKTQPSSQSDLEWHTFCGRSNNGSETGEAREFTAYWSNQGSKVHTVSLENLVSVKIFDKYGQEIPATPNVSVGFEPILVESTPSDRCR